jgi:hypothetical protein
VSGDKRPTAYFALSIRSTAFDVIYEPHLSLCYGLKASFAEIQELADQCEEFLESLGQWQFCLSFRWEKGWSLKPDYTCPFFCEVFTPLFRIVHNNCVYSRAQMDTFLGAHISFVPADLDQCN